MRSPGLVCETSCPGRKPEAQHHAWAARARVCPRGRRGSACSSRRQRSELGLKPRSPGELPGSIQRASRAEGGQREHSLSVFQAASVLHLQRAAGLSQPGSRARCFDRNLLIFPQEDASRCSPTGGTARHRRRGTGSAAGPPGRGGFRRLSGSRLLRLAHSAVQVHRL